MPLTLNRATPSTTIESSPYNLDQSQVEAVVNNMRPQISIFLEGTRSVAANVSGSVKLLQSLTFVAVDLRAKTAPVGSAFIIDILKNGSTIFSTKPQVADGSSSGGGSAVFSGAGVVSGDILTWSVEQIGSSTAGSDVTVSLYFRY